MTIDLADYEKGPKYKGDYDADLLALQERLARVQAAYIIHGKTAIVLLEGWDAGGKGGIIQRMCAEWDPRHFQVWPIGAPTAEEKQRHFLYRFWTRMPGKGSIAIFDRSWYGRVLVERIEGFADTRAWKRGYKEINAFEAQIAELGVTLIKLFVHVSQESQDKRLADRLDDPWKRWKTGAEDYRNRAKRAEYLTAYADMFAQCHTKAAPWTVIDGNNKKSGRIAALTYVVEALEKGVSMEPPAVDPEVVALAKAAFGYKLRSSPE